ncbi:DNA polymerase III PolC-type-like [Saccostrea cucullata]|uniref:DNA polymerase III PolC-type-like n=1 Tax=Saccostrea cuccullata TaxID=36930 RepID=UPI002ED203CF
MQHQLKWIKKKRAKTLNLYIPPALPLPARTSLPKDEYTWIFFDLETTGLGLTSEILEIGATRGNDTFQRFIKPVGSISTKATLVHGIHLKNNTLMKREEVLQTTDLHSALEDFSSWLSSSKNNVLLGHNGNHFDFPLLVKNLLYRNVSTNVVGFVDTLEVFRDILDKHSGSYSQESLMKESGLQCTGQAHCALYDSVNLQKLTKFHNIEDESLIKHSVSSEYVYQIYSHSQCKEKNYKSLHVLVHEKVISDFMANKIASSGLNFSHLQLAFQRHQEDGIRNLFIENVGGKVRVSKCKKIWSSVAN